MINSLLTSKLWHTARPLPLAHHTSSIIKPLRQFFWNNRQPSISWKILCLPRESGGLGIIPIEEQSKALLLRHLIPLYIPTHPFRSFAHDFLEFVLKHICQLSSHIPILLAPTHYAAFFRRYPLLYSMLKVASSFTFTNLPHPLHPSLFLQLPLAMFLQSPTSLRPTILATLIAHFIHRWPPNRLNLIKPTELTRTSDGKRSTLHRHIQRGHIQ